MRYLDRVIRIYFVIPIRGYVIAWGTVALTVSGGKISGEYTGVTPGTMPDGSDAKVTPAKDRF